MWRKASSGSCNSGSDGASNGSDSGSSASGCGGGAPPWVDGSGALAEGAGVAVGGQGADSQGPGTGEAGRDASEDVGFPLLPVLLGRGRRGRRPGSGLSLAERGNGPPVGPAPGPEGRSFLRLLTANLNSWATMRYWVEDLVADVLLLQETRVPPGGLAAARAQAKDAGWAGVWQAAVQGAAGGPASGGLAVLVRGAVGLPRCRQLGAIRLAGCTLWSRLRSASRSAWSRSTVTMRGSRGRRSATWSSSRTCSTPWRSWGRPSGSSAVTGLRRLPPFGSSWRLATGAHCSPGARPRCRVAPVLWAGAGSTSLWQPRCWPVACLSRRCSRIRRSIRTVLSVLRWQSVAGRRRSRASTRRSPSWLRTSRDRAPSPLGPARGLGALTGGETCFARLTLRASGRSGARQRRAGFRAGPVSLTAATLAADRPGGSGCALRRDGAARTGPSIPTLSSISSTRAHGLARLLGTRPPVQRRPRVAPAMACRAGPPPQGWDS